MLLDPMRSDGAPTLEFLRAVPVSRSRTPHVCRTCKGTIPAGSACRRITAKTSDDKVPASYYEHAEIGECLKNLEAWL